MLYITDLHNNRKNITNKTHAIDINTLADVILEVCDQHLSTLVT